ncbi:MAG: U32 family peptidase C-terminal domain-containing protein, partial [Desulfobacterales bacterium]|nr:U32 family peptidase C-terminal domain-containing protein [Desulfobacterales bacterium]
VLENISENNICRVRLNVKDRLTVGSEIEVITPEMQDFKTTIILLQKENGDKIDVVHPGTVTVAYCQGQLKVGNILRRQILETGVSV